MLFIYCCAYVILRLGKNIFTFIWWLVNLCLLLGIDNLKRNKMKSLIKDKVGYNKFELNVTDSIMEDSVCTVNSSRDDALQWAKLFEKAPDMLKMLKDLRDGDYPSINGALWQSINDSIDGLA